MVKHIVLFNVRDGVDVQETVRIADSVLKPLVGKIPGLNHVEVSANFAGTDFTLYCELESREAMALYADHPLHTEAKTHFFHLLSSRTAADYEV